MPEFHFSFFVLMSVLLYYRNIVPLVLFTTAAIVQHIVLDHLQRAGFECYVFRGVFSGMPAVALHSAYIGVQAIFLTVIAKVLRDAALQADETAELVSRMSGANESSGLISVTNTFYPSPATGKLSSVGQAYNDYAENMVHIIGAFKMLQRDMGALTQMATELTTFSEEKEQITQRSTQKVKDLQKLSGELTSRIEAGVDDIIELNAKLQLFNNRLGSTGQDLTVVRERFGASKAKADESFKDFLGVQSSISAMKHLSLKIYAITHPLSTGQTEPVDGALLHSLNAEFMAQTKRVETAVHDYNSSIFEVMQTINRFGEQIGDAAQLLNNLGEEISGVAESTASIGRQADKVMNLQVSSQKQVIELLAEYEKSSAINKNTVSRLEGAASSVTRARSLVVEMDSRLSKFTI